MCEKTDIRLEDIGRAVDKLYSLRSQRLEKQKELDALKDREDIAKQVLLSLYDEAGITSVGGTLAKGTKTEKQRVIITDIDVFQDYVKETGAVWLLERRVAQRAALEVMDDIEIPGLGIMTNYDVSLTKTKRG